MTASANKPPFFGRPIVRVICVFSGSGFIALSLWYLVAGTGPYFGSPEENLRMLGVGIYAAMHGFLGGRMSRFYKDSKTRNRLPGQMAETRSLSDVFIYLVIVLYLALLFTPGLAFHQPAVCLASLIATALVYLASERSWGLVDGWNGRLARILGYTTSATPLLFAVFAYVVYSQTFDADMSSLPTSVFVIAAISVTISLFAAVLRVTKKTQTTAVAANEPEPDVEAEPS